MKKLLIAVSLLFSLCMTACDTRSPEQKALDEANEALEDAKQNAQEAKEKYEEVKNTLEEYEEFKESLK